MAGRILPFDCEAALTYPEIAGLLVLSPRTVQNHVQNTLIKLQLHNKAQLVRYALEQGMG